MTETVAERLNKIASALEKQSKAEVVCKDFMKVLAEEVRGIAIELEECGHSDSTVDSLA